MWTAVLAVELDLPPPPPSMVRSAIVDAIVPLKLVSEANSRGGGWHAKHVRTAALRVAIDAALARFPAPKALGFETRITRLYARPANAFDSDNLVRASKAVRDAIAAWLKRDDRDPNLRWHHRQELHSSNGVRVEICAFDKGEDHG